MPPRQEIECRDARDARKVRAWRGRLTDQANLITYLIQKTTTIRFSPATIFSLESTALDSVVLEVGWGSFLLLSHCTLWSTSGSGQSSQVWSEHSYRVQYSDALSSRNTMKPLVVLRSEFFAGLVGMSPDWGPGVRHDSDATRTTSTWWEHGHGEETSHTPHTLNFARLRSLWSVVHE